MKNIIKKILKESELDWIKDQNPEPWEEFMFPYTELEGKLGNTNFGKRIVYRDPKGEWIFFHNQNPKNGYVYFNYERIWVVFENRFGFEYGEIQDLLEGWLGEHYNLRGVTTKPDEFSSFIVMGEHYNLREETDDWDWAREPITYPIHEKKDFEVGMVGSWFYESYETQIEDCEVIFIWDEENCGNSASDCVITKLTPENYRDPNVPSWPCSFEIPYEEGRCLYTIVNEKNPFIVKNFNI